MTRIGSSEGDEELPLARPGAEPAGDASAPISSSWAVSRRAERAGRVRRTSPSGGAFPLSSSPEISIAAAASPRLTRRSRLC